MNQLQVDRQVRMPKERLPGFVGCQVLPGQRHVHTGFRGVGRPDALIPVAMADQDPSPIFQTPAERRDMVTHRLLRLVRDPEGSWALSIKRQQMGLRDDLNVLGGDITLRQVRVVVAGDDADPQSSEALVTTQAFELGIVEPSSVDEVPCDDDDLSTFIHGALEHVLQDVASTGMLPSCCQV